MLVPGSRRAAKRTAMSMALTLMVLAASSGAQQPASPETRAWTAEADHRNMMEQLGITALRPGPSGNDAAPNHANYDEARANPFPSLPDVLTLKTGTKVTTAGQWLQRRAEIVEDFERDIVGRVPANVPTVWWNWPDNLMC